MELQVYIANLGKYNEGELVGAWFTPPIDYDDMKERIGLNGEYEEYAIHDYELPFDVHEFTPISEINRLCEEIQELDGSPILDELKEIQGMWFSSISELLDAKDDIHCYTDCDSMEDVARYYVEETGQLGEVPANLQNYIDYQALGRDMEIEGNYLVTSHGVFEYIG
ncbi:antirestriction protein ArdA [Enterococcus durans]|uniref:antirestriction protein ArdA n=1 Tax=Enterococcus durans TaxID=53345 RepID=UPI000EC3D68A|nr:antirestriction protein ArdA [Enterococcus durans]MCD5009796.1 antirestriction protein ArdA [Enterococcus durans]MDB1683648.1 antirestriction protein ArdA [Enterococcus durans]HCB27074.1 antirestriction protein ArdA [Enterococcus sp.]